MKACGEYSTSKSSTSFFYGNLHDVLDLPAIIGRRVISDNLLFDLLNFCFTAFRSSKNRLALFLFAEEYKDKNG